MTLTVHDDVCICTVCMSLTLQDGFHNHLLKGVNFSALTLNLSLRHECASITLSKLVRSQQCSIMQT